MMYCHNHLMTSSAPYRVCSMYTSTQNLGKPDFKICALIFCHIFGSHKKTQAWCWLALRDIAKGKKSIVSSFKLQHAWNKSRHRNSCSWTSLTSYRNVETYPTLLIHAEVPFYLGSIHKVTGMYEQMTKWGWILLEKSECLEDESTTTSLE